MIHRRIRTIAAPGDERSCCSRTDELVGDVALVDPALSRLGKLPSTQRTRWDDPVCACRACPPSIAARSQRCVAGTSRHASRLKGRYSIASRLTTIEPIANRHRAVSAPEPFAAAPVVGAGRNEGKITMTIVE